MYRELSNGLADLVELAKQEDLRVEGLHGNFDDIRVACDGPAGIDFDDVATARQADRLDAL